MKLFIPFVYTWMKVTLQQELQWIKNAISIDKVTQTVQHLTMFPEGAPFRTHCSEFFLGSGRVFVLVSKLQLFREAGH